MTCVMILYHMSMSNRNEDIHNVALFVNKYVSYNVTVSHSFHAWDGKSTNNIS